MGDFAGGRDDWFPYKIVSQSQWQRESYETLLEPNILQPACQLVPTPSMLVSSRREIKGNINKTTLHGLQYKTLKGPDNL